MTKPILTAITFTLFIYLAFSQNRPNQRPEDNLRPNHEGPNGRGEKPRPKPRPNREGRPMDSIDEEEGPIEHGPQKGKNNNETLEGQHKPFPKVEEKLHHKQKQGDRDERPLLKLIFVLVGVLCIIVLILLMKLLSRNQPQPIRNNVSGSEMANPEPTITISTPQIKLDQQIEIYQKRLQKLQRLKKIKEKYLVSTGTSQIQLAAEQKKIQEELKTPAFAIPYTFRNTM